MTNVKGNLLRIVTRYYSVICADVALLFVAVTAAEIVRARLLQRGIREPDLQKALGIKRPMANMMLSGERGIAFHHLDRLAALLNMPLSQLFDERDLSRHTPNGVLDPHSKVGGSDVPASVDPRVQQLKRERDELEERITAIENVARSLFALVRPAKENGPSRADKPRRGRPRRKTA